MAEIINKNLGTVTAYAYAVEGGYTGTEAEFTELLGRIGIDLEQIENLEVVAETLPEGSTATASYSDGVLTLGIPKGDTGAKGDTGERGETGATGNGIASIALTSTVGSVKTYTITFTDGTTTTFEVRDGEVTETELEDSIAGVKSDLEEEIYKYDDILRVIKITDATTTMGDISSTLNGVNTAGDHVVFDVSALNVGMYLCTIYMGAGYYRISDMVTGFVANGFWKSSDLLKDIIKGGSQSTGKHYTVQWDKVNAQGVRLNDASSITTDTTNFVHNGSVNPNYDNPFDDIYPWSERKLCNIDLDLYMALTDSQDLTECVVAWEDDANFSYNHQYGVWVYTPAFFGRSYTLGNYRYFDVTDEALPNNIEYKPSIVGRWLGCDVTLTIDGASKHTLLPKVGMPLANVSGTNMHQYAKNYGGSLNDIYTLDAVSLLYVVEFANLNVQNSIGAGISGLYKQTMHPTEAVTNSNTIKVNNDASLIVGAIVDLGTTDGAFNTARTYITGVSVSDGVATLTLADAVTVTTATFVSVHGGANIADEAIGSMSGYIGTNGKANAYYRGQTFYANKFQYILGCYRQTGTGEVWIAPEGETDDYDALNTTKHIDTGVALTATSGYIKSLGECDGLSFPAFCTEVGGSSSAPVGDYCYVPALTTDNTVLWFGGYSNSGADCGFYGYWNNTASYSRWYCGACPRLK